MVVSGSAGAPPPWGWWLRVVGGFIEDPQGRRWSSVRDAYWEGHLGFPAAHVVPEQHELLLRVLMALDRPYGDGTERRHDLFGGDMVFSRFYTCWLHAVGLTEPAGHGLTLEDRLSEEGRSVLAMLQATRDPGHAVLSFEGVRQAARAAGRTGADDAREEALRSFERGASRMQFVFAREALSGRPVVTLTGVTGGRMPLRRVMWSLSFPDAGVRDDFFAWMAGRVDRWEDWGAMAYRKGADALTTHLLVLFAARLGVG